MNSRLGASDDTMFANLIEKKKLESRLQQKEFLIYDLQDQVREKSDKLEELNNNLEEFKRKYVEAQHFEHKAFEYDILEEKYSIIEKEKVYLEEKCKKYIKDLDDLKILRAANEKLENEIAELTHENTLMETRENYNQIELQRLRSVDADLSSMTKSNQKKEEKILDLLSQKSQLDVQLIELQEKYKNKKMELDEKIENLTNDNAVLQNQINMLNAETANLKENHALAIREGEKKKYEYECVINDLNLKINSIDATNLNLVKKLESVEFDLQVSKTQKEHFECELNSSKEKIASIQQEHKSFNRP